MTTGRIYQVAALFSVQPPFLHMDGLCSLFHSPPHCLYQDLLDVMHLCLSAVRKVGLHGTN